jgi:hypothetical protein
MGLAHDWWQAIGKPTPEFLFGGHFFNP